MYKEALRPAWVEINLAALNHNVKEIRRKIGEDKKIIGVVKADAYGHGAFNVADVLKENGVNSFAVATIPEAVALRRYFEESCESYDDYGYEFDESMLSDDENPVDFDIESAHEIEIPEPKMEEILVLGLIPDIYADIIAEYDLTPVVCDFDNAKALDEAAAALGKTVSVLIALDTGMGRIGYVIPDEGRDAALAEILDEVRRISELPHTRIAGVISHMSTADEADKTYAHLQTEKYKDFVSALKESGIFAELPFFTFANSAAIMELDDTHFDAVRPGIVLYGCYPSDEVDKTLLDLKPVMSVKALIKHLKEVPAGFSVGYGRKFVSDRPSKIATLSIGYADGYPRRYSTADCNQLPCVLVNGRYAPLAGKICMDQVMVDVTDIPDVNVGDEAIIMGSMPAACGEGLVSVTADDIASAIGTINYEILCGFALRLPRIYKYFI